MIRFRKIAFIAALAALSLLGLDGGPGLALAQVNPFTSIGLEWTAGGDDGTVGRASSYEMKYGTSAPAPGDTTTWWNAATAVASGILPIPKTSGGTDSARVTGLTPGTTYYFVLRSRDDGGNYSAYSNVASATTVTCDPPTASPDPFSATADTGLVDLAWTANDPAANVRVYRGTGASPPTGLLTTLSAGTTSYQDTNVQPGTTYSYRVAFAITCNAPPSYSVTVAGPYSSTRTVTLPGTPPAPPSETGAATIHAYPNPSSGSVQFVFRLEGTVAREANVRLFDMAGHWIATIVDQRLNPGEQTITWPRTDRNGRRVSPGYYEAIGTIGDTRVRERLVLTP